MRCFVQIVMIGILLSGCSSPANPEPASTQKQDHHAGIDTSGYQIIIDLQVLEQNNLLPKADTIAIKQDPHFKDIQKKYIGFSLEALLKMAFDRFPLDTAHAILHFECSDGYTPTMPLSFAYGTNKSFVVSSDADAPPGKKWTAGFEKFAPYYIVWQEYIPSEHRYVYPYNLLKIKILSLTKEFEHVYPFQAEEMVRGFNLFSQNCMKCHAINGVGGVMGPEFNYPKNITEYWTDEHIIAFAKNSQSFRLNSKMPPVQDVSDEDFKEIIKYLKFIAKHKVIK